MSQSTAFAMMLAALLAQKQEELKPVRILVRFKDNPILTGFCGDAVVIDKTGVSLYNENNEPVLFLAHGEGEVVSIDIRQNECLCQQFLIP